MQRSYFVYIVTNKNNSTFYIGITNNLIRRVDEHKKGAVDGFAKKYKLRKLIYYEQYSRSLEAITREKQLKNWHRQWKINLILSTNPKMNDLYLEILT